ncbi:PadR family transcriptional regulator [Actinospongicola halichondriae]|uniref:PadR family transcriptional regulator n=1 Tax=Actinospongicola halichondriae TaxID=3236844 RepID=UPI003D5D1EAF
MAVREGLLVLLAEGERHGYQLKTEWEAATGGTWTVNVGQVYTTLDRLVRDGLVSVDDDGDQKRYALTAEGREAVTAFWDEPIPAAALSRDGLVAHVLLAVHADRALALDVITRHRTAMTRQLQTLRRATGPSTDQPLAEALAVDAALVRIESNLRWLDRCEQRLLSATPANGRSPSPADGR